MIWTLQYHDGIQDCHLQSTRMHFIFTGYRTIDSAHGSTIVVGIYSYDLRREVIDLEMNGIQNIHLHSESKQKIT